MLKPQRAQAPFGEGTRNIGSSWKFNKKPGVQLPSDKHKDFSQKHGWLKQFEQQKLLGNWATNIGLIMLINPHQNGDLNQLLVFQATTSFQVIQRKTGVELIISGTDNTTRINCITASATTLNAPMLSVFHAVNPSKIFLVVYPRGIKTLDVSPQQCRMKVTTVDIPNFPQNKLITQNTSAHVWTLPKIQEECLGYTLWYAHKIVWKSGTIPINQSDYLHEPDQPPACTWWSGRHAATRAPRTAKAAKPTVSVQKTS